MILCTIERANGIFNHLFQQEEELNRIGMIVLDEIHMMGDVHRGYILELLLSKLLYKMANIQVCKVH